MRSKLWSLSRSERTSLLTVFGDARGVPISPLPLAGLVGVLSASARRPAGELVVLRNRDEIGASGVAPWRCESSARA